MQRTVNGLIIECVKGDITDQPDCQIIVNAANKKLGGGGGADGAIHRAAGPELVKASRKQAPIEAGDAVITPAFDLPNDYVVHCAGPVYSQSQPVAEQLANCYINAMRLAAEHDAERIAFPAISAGIYGYPLDEAGRVAIKAVSDSADTTSSVELARFVLFSDDALTAFSDALRALVDPDE